MTKGFLSFALATVFVLALVASAARFSQYSPDNSYQKYQAAALQEAAIKHAFYRATGEAAEAALPAAAAALKNGEDPRQPIIKSVHYQANNFAYLLMLQGNLHGYGTVFWCGKPDEGMRKAASAKMQESGHALAPDSTTELSLSTCQNSFDVDLRAGKVIIYDLGVSVYSRDLKIGYAAVFPSSYLVEFPVDPNLFKFPQGAASAPPSQVFPI